MNFHNNEKPSDQKTCNYFINKNNLLDKIQTERSLETSAASHSQ